MSTVERAIVVPRITRGPRVVRVALAGCGVVGGELVRLLAHGAGEIRARHGIRFELVSVLVKHPDRPRPGELERDRLTTDVDAFLSSGAGVWVEAIGGIDPALRIARHALAAGKRLVTANKALLAAHGPSWRRWRGGAGRGWTSRARWRAASPSSARCAIRWG